MEHDRPLSSREPSEILEPSFVAAYEKAMDLVWLDILRLNGYVFVLDKLLSFATSFFLGPGRDTFVELVTTSLTESAIVIITKLTTPRKDRLTMQRLRSEIRRHLGREYQPAFEALNTGNHFDMILKEAREKYRTVRNNPIAHLVVDEDMRPTVAAHGIPFEGLSETASKLSHLFETLCFGYQRMMLPLDYSTAVCNPPDFDARPDIEYILDLLVKDSPAFTEPDTDVFWPELRKQRPPQHLELINEYRRKFGMPEV